MNNLERKEYNKIYYQANRENVLEKACIRVPCPCCNRVITKNRLTAHLKTELCKRTQYNDNYLKERINNIYDMVAKNPIV